MGMTHSITVSMVASYMPTGSVEGLGKLSGTAVSFTDLLLGACSGINGLLLFPASRFHQPMHLLLVCKVCTVPPATGGS